jgi:hypothetical protein
VTAPRHERVCHLDVLAWEAALQSAAASRNGRTVGEDVVWLVSHRALAAPATAALCPAVRSVLPPDVLAAVLALAAEAGVTTVAEPASQPAGSAVTGRSWRTVAEAARALGLTCHGVRARCRRGTLPAVKEAGQWRVTISG